MRLTSLVSCLIALGLVAQSYAQTIDPAIEPLVRAPYPGNLDTAASNEWWEVARAAQRGELGTNRHPKNSRTVTGRHFLDLECERDEVVAFAIYTVHDHTLKMTAQLCPLFPNETRVVRLEVRHENEWVTIAESEVNDLGWSALFRVDDWDDSQTVPYRVRHGERAQFTGTIRRSPVDQDIIVVASLSCNSSRDRMGRQNYVRNLLAIDPDLLFFAGDQHYDHTEHTAGWIMWGTQFRDVIKDRPVVTIPDDHDVGQANLWGENGKKASSGAGNDGGYFYHPEYVKQVERCQTAHLPDPYDATPIGQGLNVYYTNLNVGGIDFAIIEDRKFKSGPKGKVPQQGPRPDHIRDPSYDPASIDIQGLSLLGDRQLKFLDDWHDDWRGVEMKAVLSQTPFCGAAHLHGGNQAKNRLHADLDSNGWPQTGRDSALRAIRRGFACHLSGDQHLATLVQHGIDEFDDGPWSMVSPAIVNTIYGRYWHPEDEQAGADRPPGSSLPWTGRYHDGFNNMITMHAYANADANENTGNRAAGFVVVHFNKRTRSIKAECWPRDADLTRPDPVQFRGWPQTFQQIDNYNPPSWGKLGEMTFDVSTPVVQVVDEESAEILYTLRVRGRSFTPRAPRGRSFTIKAGVDEPDQVVVQSTAVEAAQPVSVILRGDESGPDRP